jgi:hypothetical protein
MIIFYGDDRADIRAAKMKALQAHFNDDSNPVAITMLKSDALSGSKSKKEKLIVNGHGNRDVIGYLGNDAEAFFADLLGKGLTNERFDSIYLMACKAGEQAQDNSILQNFAKEFGRCVQINEKTTGIKVYAPRGTLTYSVVNEQVSGQTVPKVTRIYVDTPEKEYELNEGLLLVHI